MLSDLFIYCLLFIMTSYAKYNLVIKNQRKERRLFSWLYFRQSVEVTVGRSFFHMCFLACFVLIEARMYVSELVSYFCFFL